MHGWVQSPQCFGSSFRLVLQPLPLQSAKPVGHSHCWQGSSGEHWTPTLPSSQAQARFWQGGEPPCPPPPALAVDDVEDAEVVVEALAPPWLPAEVLSWSEGSEGRSHPQTRRATTISFGRFMRCALGLQLR